MRRALATLGPQPPNFESDRRAQPRPARQGGRGRASAHAAAGRAGARRRRARRRRPHRAAVRRGAHPRRGLHHRAAGRASAPSSPGSREPGQPLVLVGRDNEDALEAAALAAAVGLAHDRRLPRRRHDLVARGAASRSTAVQRMTVPGAARALGADGVQMLDVRERSEWDARAHPRLGPRALPRHRRRAGRHRPASARSPRSAAPASAAAVAASLLKRHGAADVIHVVDGGVGTWRARRLADRALSA